LGRTSTEVLWTLRPPWGALSLRAAYETAVDASFSRPQADALQGKAVLDFIDVGKKDGKLEMGGERVGDKVRSGSRASRRRD
jgi:hypothetical protein